jgi:hypothetical protein
MNPRIDCRVAARPLALALALAALASAGSLSTAVAQPDDAAYCAALTGKYHAYVSSSLDRRPRPPPADVSAAMAGCKSNAPASIPVLEQALRNARIDLPPRG